MSSPVGQDPATRPVPIDASGKGSLLIDLRPCPTPPTYLEAFLLDIKRGVVADVTAATAEVARPLPARSAPPATPAVAGSERRGLPHSIMMATGGTLAGAGFLSAAASSRAPTSVRSQSTGIPTLHPPPVTRRRRRELIEDAPDERLLDQKRQVDLRAIEIEHEDKSKSASYVGYCMAFEILVPQNLQSHERMTNWTPQFVIVADRNVLPLKFLLLADTGTPVDSWVFCNLLWDDVDKLQGDFTSHHEKRYRNKNRIRVPPEGHFDDLDNTATLIYGLNEAEGRPISITQTLVQFTYKTRQHDPVTLPEFAIGAVFGVSPEDLERGEDGLIALGRQSNATSRFKPPAHDGSGGVRWASQTLPNVLFKKKRITVEMFTVFIDHPLLVKNADACIMFGPIYNPMYPMIFANPNDWTSIAALPGTGHWKVYLKAITFVPAWSRNIQPIPVDAEVIVDNGTSQTYLPEEAVSRLDRTLASQAGSLPNFSLGDEVHLQFARHAMNLNDCITIVGQAKRFFTSPYLRHDGAHARCIVPSVDTYILGLNFFTTFIVAFEEARDPDARILTQPHKFV